MKHNNFLHKFLDKHISIAFCYIYFRWLGKESPPKIQMLRMKESRRSSLKKRPSLIVPLILVRILSLTKGQGTVGVKKIRL
jgi:hypothetical protein